MRGTFAIQPSLARQSEPVGPAYRQAGCTRAGWLRRSDQPHRQYIRVSLQHFFSVTPTVRPVLLWMTAGAIGMPFDVFSRNTAFDELFIGDAGKVNVILLPKTCGEFSERVVGFPILRATLAERWSDTDIHIARHD